MKTTTILILVILIGSCKKTPATSDVLTGVYMSGVDSNLQNIQSYLSRHNINTAFFNDPLTNNPANPVKLEFLSSQRAILTITDNPFASRNILTSITENNENRMLLQSVDTIFIGKYMNECAPLEDLIIKKNAYSLCDAVSPYQTSTCKVVQQFPIIKSNGQLRLAYINYLVANSSPSLSCVTALKNIIGELNTGGLSQLRVNDTVIIQKMQLPLTR
jgi:hypothetical protein